MKKILTALFATVMLCGCEDSTDTKSDLRLKKIVAPDFITEFNYSGDLLESSVSVRVYDGNTLKGVYIYEKGKVTQIKYYLNNVYVHNMDISFVYKDNNIITSSSPGGFTYVYQYSYNSLEQMTAKTPYDVRETETFTYD